MWWQRRNNQSHKKRIQQIGEKEYKIICDWVAKMIHCELCKKLKFDRINKWYMHKPKFILWGLQIQTDPLISTRRPDQVKINKKNKQIK